MAYRCYCTAEEVDVRRKQMLAEGKGSNTTGSAFHLTEAERRDSKPKERPSVLRFYSTDEGETVVHDLIRGDVHFANHVWTISSSSVPMGFRRTTSPSSSTIT